MDRAIDWEAYVSSVILSLHPQDYSAFREMWENPLRVSYEFLPAGPRIRVASARISILRVLPALPVTIIRNDSGHGKLPGDGHEAARWRT